MKVIHASELPEINKQPLDGQKKLLLAPKGEMRQHTSVMHLDLLDGQLSEFRYANLTYLRILLQYRPTTSMPHRKSKRDIFLNHHSGNAIAEELVSNMSHDID